MSAPAPPRIKEVPARFRERVAGESKLDALVMIQFGGLLLDKIFGGRLLQTLDAFNDTLWSQPAA